MSQGLYRNNSMSRCNYKSHQYSAWESNNKACPDSLAYECFAILMTNVNKLLIFIFCVWSVWNVTKSLSNLSVRCGLARDRPDSIARTHASSIHSGFPGTRNYLTWAPTRSSFSPTTEKKLRVLNQRILC